MKTFLASLLACIGLSTGAAAPSTVQAADPNTINFTTPTLSNDIADLEPVGSQPGKADLVFHEDEWAQVEFLRADQLREIQQTLRDFKSFESAHRVKHGWTAVYIRRFPRKTLIAGADAVRHLQDVLNVTAGPAPVLFASNAVTGRVKGGASFDLGGNIRLYASPARNGVLVLGADVGPDPDDSRLTTAFAKLNASDQLVLVDWRQQLVLMAMSSNGRVEVWRP